MDGAAIGCSPRPSSAGKRPRMPRAEVLGGRAAEAMGQAGRQVRQWWWGARGAVGNGSGRRGDGGGGVGGRAREPEQGLDEGADSSRHGRGCTCEHDTLKLPSAMPSRASHVGSPPGENPNIRHACLFARALADKMHVHDAGAPSLVESSDWGDGLQPRDANNEVQTAKRQGRGEGEGEGRQQPSPPRQALCVSHDQACGTLPGCGYTGHACGPAQRRCRRARRT